MANDRVQANNSESSKLNESENFYIVNNPNNQAYISRWVYSLTEGELEIFTNLELKNNGTSFDNMMRFQRKLLGGYEPADFVENAEITEEKELEEHRRLLLSGFLEKNHDCP